MPTWLLVLIIVLVVLALFEALGTAVARTERKIERAPAQRSPLRQGRSALLPPTRHEGRSTAPSAPVPDVKVERISAPLCRRRAGASGVDGGNAKSQGAKALSRRSSAPHLFSPHRRSATADGEELCGILTLRLRSPVYLGDLGSASGPVGAPLFSGGGAPRRHHHGRLRARHHPPATMRQPVFSCSSSMKDGCCQRGEIDPPCPSSAAERTIW